MSAPTKKRNEVVWRKAAILVLGLVLIAFGYPFLKTVQFQRDQASIALAEKLDEALYSFCQAHSKFPPTIETVLKTEDTVTYHASLADGLMSVELSKDGYRIQCGKALFQCYLTKGFIDHPGERFTSVERLRSYN